MRALQELIWATISFPPHPTPTPHTPTSHSPADPSIHPAQMHHTPHGRSLFPQQSHHTHLPPHNFCSPSLIPPHPLCFSLVVSLYLPLFLGTRPLFLLRYLCASPSTHRGGRKGGIMKPSYHFCITTGASTHPRRCSTRLNGRQATTSHDCNE